MTNHGAALRCPGCPLAMNCFRLRCRPSPFYNAIANDGKMIQPILVKRISKAGEGVKSFQAVVLNKEICSDPTLIKIKELLEGVVERGTAKNIRDSHYKIAGKTGTAKKVKEGGGYKREYYTSFCGYFPADKPKYSCIVVIDNPKGYKPIWQ